MVTFTADQMTPERQMYAAPPEGYAVTICHDTNTMLQVASEDTVLYTADVYVRKITDLPQRQTAQQLLAPLVRAQHLSQHLSQFWLSAAAAAAQSKRG